MMFSMRSPVVRLAMLAVAMLCVLAAGEARQQANLDHLDNKDLTDLLDADVDEAFRARKLDGHGGDHEEMTMAPTPAPVAAGDRGFVGDDDFFTAAPTAMETDGASSWRSPASVVSVMAIVGTVAAAAMVA